MDSGHRFDSRQGGPERYGGSGTDSDDYGTERAVGKKSDGQSGIRTYVK